MTNEEVLEKIHEEFILRGMSEKTEDSYRCAFNIFPRYYENRDVEAMGEENIREFLLHQISIGKSTGSVNIYNSALRFIFGGVLGQNLNCRRIPRRTHHREIPTIMSKTEIVRFFSVIDNLRDRAIFETIYGAGLRVSEVARLRVQDIDSNGMRLFVHQGKGGRDRFTLLSQRNLDLLREYWKQYRPDHPDGYLFYSRSLKNSPMTSRAIEDAFNKYLELAKLPDTFTVHTLRHCFATHPLIAPTMIKRFSTPVIPYHAPLNSHISTAFFALPNPSVPALSERTIDRLVPTYLPVKLRPTLLLAIILTGLISVTVFVCSLNVIASE